MKKEQQHINHLLSRWISGEITASEERELENAAEQDEVLRDAWAGYQAHAGADHEARLAKLRGRLTRPQPITVSILRPWMRIAAAVALLLVAGWVVFQTQTSNDSALATSQAVEAEEALKDGAISEREELLDTEEITVMEELATDITIAESPATPAIARAPGSEPESVVTTGASAVARDGIVIDDESDELLADKKDKSAELAATDDRAEESIVLSAAPVTEKELVVTTPPPPPSSIVDAYRTQNQAAPPTSLENRSAISNSGIRIPNKGYRVISGYVTDEQGNPLIGASILEVGSANGTVADIDGYYELTVSNQSEKLLVNYTGFAATTVKIGEEDEIRIVLNESNQVLDEVVVTDLGASYAQQRDEEETVESVKPVGGFSELRKYLKDNATANAGRANVKIRFYVQADGRPTNASIISSTNPGLNTEAIRLIEEGPNWVLSANEAPVEVVYTVKFR